MTGQQKGFKGIEQGTLYKLSGGWVWMKLVDAKDREYGKPQIIENVEAGLESCREIVETINGEL